VPSADAVVPAVRELVEAGHDLLHEAREEPWGQTVAGFSHPRARSSASPSRRCSTTERRRTGSEHPHMPPGGMPVTSNLACVPLARSTYAAPAAVSPPGWSP
jgi:hypothetical protein